MTVIIEPDGDGCDLSDSLTSGLYFGLISLVSVIMEISLSEELTRQSSSLPVSNSFLLSELFYNMNKDIFVSDCLVILARTFWFFKIIVSFFILFFLLFQ